MTTFSSLRVLDLTLLHSDVQITPSETNLTSIGLPSLWTKDRVSQGRLSRVTLHPTGRVIHSNRLRMGYRVERVRRFGS